MSKNKKNAVKAIFDKKILEIEQRNEALKVKVRDYKNEGDTKWESFKQEFNHDMEELRHTLSDLTKDNVK